MAVWKDDLLKFYDNKCNSTVIFCEVTRKVGNSSTTTYWERVVSIGNHAEVNLINRLNDVEGILSVHIYINWSPCSSCAYQLIDFMNREGIK